MITRGVYEDKDLKYNLSLDYRQNEKIVVVYTSEGKIVSAYKRTGISEYAYKSMIARDIMKTIDTAYKGCNSKNAMVMPSKLGACTAHNFVTRKTINNEIILRGKDIAACTISKTNEDYLIDLGCDFDNLYKDNLASKIPFVQLTTSKIVKTDMDVSNDEDELMNVPVRSIEEIALTKHDTSWIKSKKYYIINNDVEAEKILAQLDQYKGAIAYDTETTGLKINCFGQVNSEYAKSLEKYNNEHPDNKIRVDKLVGVIFCVTEGESFYFALGNKKYKNLYSEDTSIIRAQLIRNFKQKYYRKYCEDKLRFFSGDADIEHNTIDPEELQMLYDYNDLGKVIEHFRTKYEAKDFELKAEPWTGYWLKTKAKDITNDCIFMERCRSILETHHIVGHNCAYDWKVAHMYYIDTNIADDTMLLHELMYKFRNGRESSKLKSLTHLEFGVETWELEDYFPSFKEDDSGKTKESGKAGKKAKPKIDFSYMDYKGTLIYAPADGDFTLALYHRYKNDLMTKFSKKLQELYRVECIVACAIACMEFYGHRLDETKIEQTRVNCVNNRTRYEFQFRDMVGYSSQEEKEIYEQIKELEANGEAQERVNATFDKLRVAIDKANENPDTSINMSSNQQMSKLFYSSKEEGGLGYECPEEKWTVKAKIVAQLAKEKNNDGTDKNPAVKLYQQYIDQNTRITKFFGVLQDFMYPGGFIFSSFGQISTNTGRMSCKHPNAQQYPKDLAKITVPRTDCVNYDADFSQIEYRVLTGLAKNEELAKLFADPDSDYHTLMASLMYEVPYASVTSKMRKAAKSFNFGIPYGMGMKSLAILLCGNASEESVAEAKKKYEDYFKNQPKTRQFFIDVKEFAVVHGYTETAFGRRREYNFAAENQAARASALRQAGNAIIQGCLDGNALIQTKELGIVRIKDAVNRHLHVWDGTDWSNGDILYSGKKQKCIVTFSNGQKFTCSPIHKFLVKSHRGEERFVECKDLITKEKSNNPHRVMINKEFTNSDFKYSSDYARLEYTTHNHESRNVFLDDINDSFKEGVILGRLASNGSIFNREVGGSNIMQFVAEHESEVGDILYEYMKPLEAQIRHNELREGRTQTIDNINVYSKSLVKEIEKLNIKEEINDNIFMDTEMLRGFLRGIFDDDGGISGSTITLTFGKQRNFEKYCSDVQKALQFFGIRSRYYKYEDRSKIIIKTNDNQRFLDLIGFINSEKQEKGRQLKCKTDEHIFGRCIIPEKVEITDEWIDMYDVCNTDKGYYVADGIITHNTAADVYKMAVARTYLYIRKHKLWGKLMIINMIHDEQLAEINARELNVKKVAADIASCMQLKIEGFPPLYVGAGVGKAWGYAKGKQNEIHPTLMTNMIEKEKNSYIYKTRKEMQEEFNIQDVYDYFDNEVIQFRHDKVLNYIKDEANWNKPLHPAVGGIINLQFNYGRGDDAKGYKGPNGETYSDNEFLAMNLQDFINENGLQDTLKASMFVQDNAGNFENSAKLDEEEEEQSRLQEDGETEGEFDTSDEAYKGFFSMLEDSGELFGCSPKDLIESFDLVVSQDAHICGIDMRKNNAVQLEKIRLYLDTKVIFGDFDTDDKKDALQIAMIDKSGKYIETGVYVEGVKLSELQKIKKSCA